MKYNLREGNYSFNNKKIWYRIDYVCGRLSTSVSFKTKITFPLNYI